MINQGNYVLDSITGFKGIATGRAVYMTGCIQILVTPEKAKPGDECWIDEKRLRVVSENIYRLPGSEVEEKEGPAGPQNVPKEITPP